MSQVLLKGMVLIGIRFNGADSFLGNIPAEGFSFPLKIDIGKGAMRVAFSAFTIAFSAIGITKRKPGRKLLLNVKAMGF